MFTYNVWTNVSLVRSNEMIRLYVKDRDVSVYNRALNPDEIKALSQIT